MRILILSKRQYTNKDLLNDRYGRLYKLPDELAKLGHRVVGICLSYRHNNEGLLLGPAVDGSSVNWYSVNLGKKIFPGISRYWKLIEVVLAKEKPDIILASSDVFHLAIGFRIAKINNIPFVTDLYDNYESFNFTKYSGLLPILKKIVRESNGVVCVSENLSEYVQSEYKIKGSITTITNGVSTDQFCKIGSQVCRSQFGLPVDARLIGTAGSIGPSRGINTLFDAFSKLSCNDPTIHLVLAGSLESGCVLPSIRNVHYLGELDYGLVPKVFNSLDVGVISNIDSSFGRYCFPQKAYEMLACGLPIVAANVGSLSRLLRDLPEILYDPNDIWSLEKAIRCQLKYMRMPDFVIPEWNNLAVELEMFLFQTLDLNGRTPHGVE